MKKFLLILFSSVIFGFGAEWYDMGCANKNVKIFVDISSIEVSMQDSNTSNISTMKMWVKYLYTKPTKINKIKNVKYTMEKQAVNYLDKTIRSYGWHLYNQDGGILYSDDIFTEIKVVPDSLGDCTVSFVEYMFEEYYKKDLNPIPLLKAIIKEQNSKIDKSKVKWDKKPTL